MDLLFENLKKLIDAPNGIEKARQLILQLAIQGKLVKQDPNDEPASELLKKIKKERERLIAEGKIRRPKKFKRSNTKIFRSIPNGWAGNYIGDIITLEYGKGTPKNTIENEAKIPVYGANGILRFTDKANVIEKCLIIGRKGSAGKINKVYEPCWVSDVCYYVIPSKNLDYDFVFYLLLSLQLENLAKGIKPGLNRNEVYEQYVLLPPLNEQKRIVEKVNSLMSLLDEIEEKRERRNQKRIKLNNASLNKLITSKDDIELKSNWKRLEENFSTLYSVPENVEKLKQAILQLAVQGKLVKQDPNDEPASELLKKIKKEKERLIAEGKIRRQRELPPIKDEEKPFELPKGWVFERFGKITINRDGERVPISSEERIPRKGKYDYYGASGVIDKIDGYLFDKSLLLIGEDGANLINRSSPIAFIAHGKYWVNNHAHVIDGYSLELLKYLEVYINVIDLKPFVTGTAQPKMNQTKLNSIIVALPPFNEQKRIVEKVNELMSLCNALEEKLKQIEAEAERLVGAIMNKIINQS